MYNSLKTRAKNWYMSVNQSINQSASPPESVTAAGATTARSDEQLKLPLVGPEEKLLTTLYKEALGVGIVVVDLVVVVVATPAFMV